MWLFIVPYTCAPSFIRASVNQNVGVTEIHVSLVRDKRLNNLFYTGGYCKVPCSQLQVSDAIVYNRDVTALLHLTATLRYPITQPFGNLLVTLPIFMNHLRIFFIIVIEL